MVKVDVRLSFALEEAPLLDELMQVPGGAVFVVRVPHRGLDGVKASCLCGLAPALFEAVSVSGASRAVVRVSSAPLRCGAPAALVGVVADHRREAFAGSDAVTAIVRTALDGLPLTIPKDMHNRQGEHE